jgi:hypothetical protein
MFPPPALIWFVVSGCSLRQHWYGPLCLDDPSAIADMVSFVRMFPPPALIWLVVSGCSLRQHWYGCDRSSWSSSRTHVWDTPQSHLISCQIFYCPSFRRIWNGWCSYRPRVTYILVLSSCCDPCLMETSHLSEHISFWITLARRTHVASLPCSVTDSIVTCNEGKQCRSISSRVYLSFEHNWPLHCCVCLEYTLHDRLCGLLVRVLGYRSGGPGSIPGTIRKKVVGLERGPLSLVSTTEELLGRKVAAPVLKTENTAVEIRHADHVAPFIHKKLAITSPTSGSRSVGIVRSRSQTMEFSFSTPYIPPHVTVTTLLRNMQTLFDADVYFDSYSFQNVSCL